MAPNGSAPTETEVVVAEPPANQPAATSAPSADTNLIRNQLREKERLVTALTERLEQAAEQLDRLRRTGVDKGRRPNVGGGGLPPELVEEHKTTLEDLKRVIARWEDIQAEGSLGRIETQISELRDLLVSSGTSLGHGTSHLPASSAARERPAEAAPAKPAEAGAPRPAGKAGGNAWWEAQKAALMGETPPPEVQAALKTAAEPAPTA